MTTEIEKDIKTPGWKRSYEKKRTKIGVSFNLESSEESRMYEFAKSVRFSQWVKDKIAQEINQR